MALSRLASRRISPEAASRESAMDIIHSETNETNAT